MANLELETLMLLSENKITLLNYGPFGYTHDSHMNFSRGKLEETDSLKNREILKK